MPIDKTDNIDIIVNSNRKNNIFIRNMQNIDKPRKKTRSFSLHDDTYALILQFSEKEMGGNKSKWLEKFIRQLCIDREKA